MSPKFPVVSGKEAASALESIGFVAVSQRGSHKKITETQLTEAEAMKKLPKLTNKKICPSPSS